MFGVRVSSALKYDFDKASVQEKIEQGHDRLVGHIRPDFRSLIGVMIFDPKDADGGSWISFPSLMEVS